jgi:ATP-dependent protease ClpP protease subunit
MKTILCLLIAYYANAEILLTPENTVNFRGNVNDSSVLTAQESLARLDALRGDQNYPIYLVLDSGGGSIGAGLAFIEFAKTINNLHTINLYAASMASAIQQALPGTRYGTSYTISMFHRPKGSFQGQFGDGEVESSLKLSKDIVAILEEQNSSRMQMSLADYKQKVINEYWLVGKDNLTYHAVDVIETLKCSTDLLKLTEDIGIERFNKCPLFRTGKSIPAQDSVKKKGK